LRTFSVTLLFKTPLRGGGGIYFLRFVGIYLPSFFYPFLDVFNVAWYNKKNFFEKRCARDNNEKMYFLRKKGGGIKGAIEN